MATPQYNTKLLKDVWSNSTDFIDEFNDSPFANCITEERLVLLWALVYGRYANDPIANMDINQFKFKFNGIVYQYAPTWAKKLQIQEDLRSLTETELLEGGKNINNHAFGDGGLPGTGTLEEVLQINDQNTVHVKKSKIEALAIQYANLDDTVTETLLDRFQVCFKQFVLPEYPLLYVTPEEDEEDGDN